MGDLVDIAKELKQAIGERVILEGTVGKIPFHPVFAATLYEIKKDDKDNVVIEFNNHFKTFITGGRDREEYRKTKEFAYKNNYLLQLKDYNMTPPTPPRGVLF